MTYTVRHPKKIWFSLNQARVGRKRLGFVSIYPPKNFKSLAGLEPYQMEGQNFGNLQWLLDFLGFHIIAVCSTLNQDPLKWSGTTGDSKYMFYFEFKNRQYVCQQCGKAKTIANFGLSSSTSWSEKTKFCPHPSFDSLS